MFPDLPRGEALLYYIYPRLAGYALLHISLYPMRHVLGYVYDVPPIYSSEIERDVRELRSSGAIRVIGGPGLVLEARREPRLPGEGTLVKSRYNLVIDVADLKALLAEARRRHLGRDVATALVAALRYMEREYADGGSMIVKALREVARGLRPLEDLEG